MRAEAAELPWPHRLHDALLARSSLLGAIALWLALVQISIAASQIVLTVVVLLWLYGLAAGRIRWVSVPLTPPLLLFVGLSLAAAAFSFDPPTSLAGTKKLVLLVVPYLVVTCLDVRTAEALVLLLVVVGDLGAAVGLWQYFFGDLGDLNHRIRGFMSHYMTYSGQLMAVGALALAGALFSPRRRALYAASALAIHVALALTLTRSAWLGALVALVLLCLLRDRRLLLGIPALLVLAALLVPPSVTSRVRSFLRPDRSGLDRVYMMRTALRMTATHPWLGVGPHMVGLVYPIYVVEGAPHQENVHLHNNLAQIAAERGLPCLLAWIGFVGVGLVGAVRAFAAAPARDGPERALAAGAFALVVAGLTAGLFEYNFGDSEFQMLFLFALGVPFVLRRAPARSAR